MGVAQAELLALQKTAANEKARAVSVVERV